MTTQNDPFPAHPIPLSRAAVKRAWRGRRRSIFFAAPVSSARACHPCERDFDRFDVGGAAAVLLVLTVGVVVATLVLALELIIYLSLRPDRLSWMALVLMASFRVAREAQQPFEYRGKQSEGRILENPGS